MRYLFSFLLLAISGNIFGQFTADLNCGVGIDDFGFCKTLDLSLGHTFRDDRSYLFGGLCLQNSDLDLFNPDQFGDYNDFEQETERLYNFNLFVGGRYSVILRDSEDENSFRRIGFFPEFRFYYCPLIPRRIKYWDENDVLVKSKGPYSSQFTYGMGGGIYMGNRAGAYIALKFEVNGIDITRSLRQIDYAGKDDFSSLRKQYIISLTLHIR